MKECEETGCKLSSNGVPVNGPWYVQEPIYLKWKQWECQSDCRYNCMVEREKERETLGSGPVKYHGKWPFKRVYGLQVRIGFFFWNFFFFFDKSNPILFLLQEPLSVIFSALNLATHFHGWLTFFVLLYYKLPLTKNKKAHYEFAFLWHIYAFLSMNSWLWSAVFHSR